MTDKKTSLLDNGLIWFGAAVSIAEIMTGTYFAPLGFARGLWAILIGHVIGCAVFYLAGVIGGVSRKSAMEAGKQTFGQKGGLLFCFLNIIQLLGWTAIMIFDGASAADGLVPWGIPLWCAVIGAMIVVWVLIGINKLGRLNSVAVGLLFLLTVVLSVLIFTKGAFHKAAGELMTFGAAIELAAAMPLSWLPLVSDYTKEAADPKKASLTSAVVYGLVSCWMYVIGMGAAIYTSEINVAQIMLKVGLGVWGLLIVVFSTVLTTYLDAYSAGVSSYAVSARIDPKRAGAAVAVVGAVVAMLFSLENITGFLYFIGSVFAPMIAVQIGDFFILKNERSGAFNYINLISWLAGFGIYRYLMTLDIPSLPDILITLAICLALNKIFGKKA